MKRLFAAVIVLATSPAFAQWSAQPGETVRNAFGSERGTSATQCRGACGVGCPKSCDSEVSYECLDSSRVRRVTSYACGTHAGCREHDNCLDACSERRSGNVDCQAECHAEAVKLHGFELATSWASGRGPYDGEIRFEYTEDSPGAHEPAFRCPEGASLKCSGDAGCEAVDGARVAPVFDSYPSAGGDGMEISDFKTGRLCADRVCGQAAEIEVTGEDSCERGDCTRYGLEFDYRNADPSAPLECSTSTSGAKGDFVGDLLKQTADAIPSGDGGSGGKPKGGMAELLGVFQKVLASADSPEDVQISMAPLGKDGKPIESQRVGSQGPPPVPSSVDLPGASGHLVVPMYQLADGTDDGPKVRDVRCTHKGVPVLEATFTLRY